MARKTWLFPGVLILFIICLAIPTAVRAQSGCTSEQIKALRTAGFSEAWIEEHCKNTRFPIWSRDGQMQFNRDGEYVGSAYPECTYVAYADFEECKEKAVYARRQNAERARAREEELDRFRRQQERQREIDCNRPHDCGKKAHWDRQKCECVCDIGGTYPKCASNSR